MKVIIYEHQTTVGLEPNECSRRICVKLTEDDGTDIDSFDWRQKDNTIRFIGDYKHYAWDKVPQYKLKLWKTSDLRNYLFCTREV